MENTEEIHAFVASLNNSIANLNIALKPALLGSLEQSIEKCKSPQERIKLYHDHLYTVISILFAYLKVIGVKTETHPIMKELNRIKQSMKNFKALEEKMKQTHEKSETSAEKATEFLQQTLGTVGGKAAPPDSLKAPAISSVNFQGTHTKFQDEPSQKPESAPQKPKSAPQSIQKKSKKSKKFKANNKVQKPKTR